MPGIERLSLPEFGIAYLAALLVMGALDAVWLGWLMRDFYKQEMGELMVTTPRVVPAALFYALYPLGLVFLVLGTSPDSLAGAMTRAAVVGLMAYGAYDLTNLATLRGWSLRLSVVDMLWGALATAAAGSAAWVALDRWRG